MSEEEIEKYFFQAADMDMFKESKEAHIGIFNIRMRLNYLYPDNYQMSACMNQDGGMTIELDLPVSEIKTSLI